MNQLEQLDLCISGDDLDFNVKILGLIECSGFLIDLVYVLTNN